MNEKIGKNQKMKQSIDEKVKESKLKKFIKNLDVLIPFKGFYERFVNKDSNWSQEKIFDQSMTSAVLIGLYLSAATLIHPNPLKWSKIIKENHLKADSIQIESRMKKEAFPSQLYRQIAGSDGVMDSAEFMKFYKKADSTHAMNYSRMKEIFNEDK